MTQDTLHSGGDTESNDVKLRAWSFREPRNQIKAALIIVPTLLLTALPLDVGALGSARMLIWAMPVRVALLALGALLAWWIDRGVSADLMNVLVVAFEAVVVVSGIYFLWLEPGSFAYHLATFVLVLVVVFLLFPNPFSQKVLVVVGGTIANVVAVAMIFPADGLQVAVAGQVVLVTVVIGAILAYHMHAAQRWEHARLLRERRLNHDLRAVNVELEELATTDSLTGIKNRRHFLSIADDEMVRARRYDRTFTILLFDIDHFKVVNDTHGHAIGDLVLRAVAQACITTLRETDVLGRLGGEEFAILLTEAEDGWEQAERLRKTVASLRTTLEDGSDVAVTISVGMASTRPEDKAIDEVLHRADDALYEAKQGGRDRVARG